MPRIELQYLIKPNTTPEQEILLTHFYNQFDNGSAANRRIVNVEPLYYSGAIAGTEFLVYAATKLYICYSLIFGDIGAGNANSSRINLYNEVDVISMQLNNSNFLLNAGTGFYNYQPVYIKANNVYFSRFVAVTLYDHVIFNGYRITLV